MTDKFYIKRSDTRPYLAVIIKQGGVVYDLSDVSTVTFTMADSDGNVKVNAQTAVVTDATSGKCEYRWAVGDTNVDEEYYYGEFFFTLDDATTFTVPYDRSLIIFVGEDLD